MARPMAQYALAVVLRHAYRFDEYARCQAERRWAPRRPHAPGEVEVGVLGLGAIGGVVAETIAGQGFACAGTRAHVATCRASAPMPAPRSCPRS